MLRLICINHYVWYGLPSRSQSPLESLLSRRLHLDGLLLPFHSICKYYLDISNYYLYLLHGVKEPGFKNIGAHLLSMHGKKSSIQILRIYKYCKYKILSITASTCVSINRFNVKIWARGKALLSSLKQTINIYHAHIYAEALPVTFFQRKAQFSNSPVPFPKVPNQRLNSKVRPRYKPRCFYHTRDNLIKL